MRGFQYKHGDRPLDGYTIQRGAGRGGFGEVYYALSDSGREVALKAVQGFEAIELRGVSQCMNLKSPHLVTIFDVRHNPDGIPFVIMEFVHGPSLRHLIDEAPAGMGTQKAAFFLREMAKGLSYLHERGIVHRDLKPGNIFYEDGYVKIGDYGLSKAMSASQHSGQTMTVGTVHYMAPEIGVGKYDRSIDIYALGAVLFEMLTGQPPYLGASPGEILMKHMSGEPKVEGIEEPFATVIRKSMARDPRDRYQTVQEMVEGVFGAEHVRTSVSCFSPDSLTLVAGRVAQRVAVGAGGPTPSGPPFVPPLPQQPSSDVWQGVANWVDRAGNRLAALSGELTHGGEAREQFPIPAELRDPIPWRQRRLLACVAISVAALAGGLFSSAFHGDLFLPALFFVLCAFAGAAGGIYISRTRVLPRIVGSPRWGQRLATAGLAEAGAIVMTFWGPAVVSGRLEEHMAATYAAVLLTVLALNWNAWTSPARPKRVSFAHAAIAGLIGLVLSILFQGIPPMAMAALAGMVLALEVAWPWDPSTAAKSATAAVAMSSEAATIATEEKPPAPAPAQRRVTPPPLPRRRLAWRGRAIPDWVRWLWRGEAAVFVAVGITLLVAAGSGTFRGNEESAIAMGFGTGCFILAVISLVRSFTTRMRGWWSYLFKPMALYACLQSVLLASFFLGAVANDNDEKMIALFFLIFPGLLFPVIASIRGRSAMPEMIPSAADVMPPFPPVPELSPPAEGLLQALGPKTSSHPPRGASSSFSAARVISTGGSALMALLATMGWLLLLASVLAGVAAAVDLPALVITMDQPNSAILEREVQGIGKLARMFCYIGGYVGTFLATAIITASRRNAGTVHMLRVLLGAAALLGSTAILDHALRADWIPAYDQRQRIEPAQTVARYLDSADAGLAATALILASCALLVLLWPAKRSSLPVAAPPEVRP